MGNDPQNDGNKQQGSNDAGRKDQQTQQPNQQPNKDKSSDPSHKGTPGQQAE